MTKKNNTTTIIRALHTGDTIRIFALLSMLVISPISLASPEWRFSWDIDPMTDAPKCLVFSPNIYIAVKHGPVAIATITVQDNGVVGIQMSRGVIDSRATRTTGVRVDSNQAILGPQGHGEGIYFDTTKSKQLLSEFTNGKEVRMQVTMFPSSYSSSGMASLSGYPAAYTAYMACHLIKNSTGWAGVYIVQGNADSAAIINKVTGRNEIGVGLVAVDPRKAAGKAGLKLFDTILTIDGASATVQLLTSRLTGAAPGQKFELEVLRDTTVRKIVLQRPE